MSWSWRSDDFSRLFNPAYMAVLITSVVNGYTEERPPGMPASVAFVGLPFCLHPTVRDCLPRSVRKNLGAWLRENPGLKSEIILAAGALRAPVRQGILFSLAMKNLSWHEHFLCPINNTSAARLKRSTMENDQSAARLVGRWLAKNGSAADIFLRLGVRP